MSSLECKKDSRFKILKYARHSISNVLKDVFDNMMWELFFFY